MSDPEEITAAPMMIGVPCTIGHVEGALDMSKGHEKIIAGSFHDPRIGTVILIGVKRKDSTSLIGATAVHHARAFIAELQTILDNAEIGLFDGTSVQ